MRKIQEWMGHADFATTLIYAHFSPSPGDADQIAAAFGEAPIADRPEPAPAEVGDDPIERIAKLADLHDRGKLKDGQFEMLRDAELAKLAAA
jgi:hypothetical protein